MDDQPVHAEVPPPPVGAADGLQGEGGNPPQQIIGPRSAGESLPGTPRPDEVEDLLQFLYQCPVGLIRVDDDGQVDMINPAAVRLLAPFLDPASPSIDGRLERADRLDEVGGFDEGEHLLTVRPLLARVAPELLRAIDDDPRRLGRLPTPARVLVPAPVAEAGTVELSAVRTHLGQVMLVVLDASTERRLAERERVLAEDLAVVTAARLRTVTGLQVAVAALATAATPEQVMLAALQQGLAAAGAQAGSVCVAAPDGGFHVVSSMGLTEEPPTQWGHLPDDARLPLVDAINRQAVVLLPSPDAARAAYPTAIELLADTEDQAWAALPFTGTAALRGGMSFTFARSQSFTAEQQSILAALTDVVGQAYVRAQTFVDEQRERRRAELLARVATELDHAHLRDEDRCRVLLDLLVPELADVATLEEPGPDRRTTILAARCADPDRLPILLAAREHRLVGDDQPGGVLRVLASGRSELIEAFTEARIRQYLPDPAARDAVAALGCRSYAIVPLRANGRSIAALLLGQAESGRRFTRDDLDLVEQLAGRAALSLDNARLRDREHRTAVDLQAAMLPDLDLDVPEIEVAVGYRPAEEHLQVGGDWYDAFELPGRRLGLVIGDVVGHSLQAATVMGQLRSATIALATGASGPAEVLTRLDEFSDRLAGAQNTTLAVLDLDLATGRIRYSNAGHPPPLLRRAGQVHRLDHAVHPPLGAAFGLARADAVLQLTPGDVLVLYTDGLVEARDEPVDRGIARLAATLRSMPATLPPKALRDTLMTQILDDTRIEDDAAIMVLRYRRPAG